MRLQRYWMGAMLVLGALALPAYGQVQLEYKFKKGDKFFLQTVSTQKQTLKTLGKELKQDLENTTVFSLTVADVNADNSAVVEETIESIDVKNNGAPGGTSPADDRFSQQLKGATVKITVTPHGDITKVEGYDDLVKKVAGDDPNARKTVQAVLTQESLKHSAAEAFPLLPAGPVRMGDKWGEDKKVETPLGALGSFTTVKKYTYDGKETVDGKPVEKISCTATATYTAPKMTEGSPFPFQVTKGDLKADDIKGTVTFNAEAGRMIQSETTFHLHGTVTITTSGGTPIDTELQQEQTIKSRVLDKPPS